MNKPKEQDQHDIIYAIRTAHQSQTQLNLMADQKANILVGAIILLLTFLFTRLATYDQPDQRMLILIAVFTLLEVVAMFLGIMVIRPRTRWMKQPLKIDEMPNPLFFGFFTRFCEQDYVDYMMGRMIDNESTREILLRDFYQVGMVLKRKFALLKLAYNFAAAGMMIAVIGLLVILY